MNELNRPLIKQQAKDLIKGKVFRIFLVIFIIGLLAGNSGTSGVNINTNTGDKLKDLFEGEYYSHEYDNDAADDDYDFDSFFEDQQSGKDNPIENFESDTDSIEDIFSNVIGDNILSFISSGALIGTIVLVFIGVIVRLVLSPLQVSLSGSLVSFIRRNPQVDYDFGKELGGVFKASFNNTYGRKLGLVLLRGIITLLLTLLFVVPGVIYYYSTYFAYQLMCDNPTLSATEALELSKRMTKGNRTELFVLNLSFIPWTLLQLITFGIVGIYTMPYMETTNALYYENFRLRAINCGVISPQEAPSADEANQPENENYFTGGYNSQPYSNNNYYQPQQNNYYNNQYNQSEYYQPPKQGGYDINNGNAEGFTDSGNKEN